MLLIIPSLRVGQTLVFPSLVLLVLGYATVIYDKIFLMKMLLLLSSLSVGRMRKLQYTKASTPPLTVKNNFINKPVCMQCQLDGDSNTDRILSLLSF